MMEAASFILGIGFSLLVYMRSIRPSAMPLGRKALYFLLTTIGITGTIWLSGVLIAHFLRKWSLVS